MARSYKRWSLLAIVGVDLLLAGLLLSAHETNAQTTLQFVQSAQSFGDQPCRDIALGDLDGDGDLDLVIATSSPDVNGIWINQGGDQGGTPGTFARDPNTVLGDSVASLALGDLDGDHDLDLLLSRASTGSVLETWINQGGKQGGKTGEFKLASTVSSSGGSGSAVALGDLDGDGDLDAFETGGLRPDRVWMNDGSGVFSQSGPDLPNGNGLRLALGDLDGDGDLDAYVAGFSNDKVWINQGGRQGGTPGAFTDSRLLLDSANTRGVALGDVNRDSQLDAVVANYLSVDTVFLNRTPAGGDPLLVADSSQQFSTTNSFNVALGDLDGDGDLDAFFNVNNGTFRVFLNDGQGHFVVPALTFGTSPGPINDALALGDVDGDGDLDAVVGTGAGAKIWLNMPPPPPPPPPVAEYVSSPEPGKEINLGSVTHAANFREAGRWLDIGNNGDKPLTIIAVNILPTSDRFHYDLRDAYGFGSKGFPIGSQVSLGEGYVLAKGAHLYVLVKYGTSSDDSDPQGLKEGTLEIKSDDPNNLVVQYPLKCYVWPEGTSEYLEILISYLFGLSSPGASMRTATLTASPATCNDTVTLGIDQGAPHSLSVQVPDAFGGGTMEVSDFEGSLTVSLQPIPADTNNCAINVAGGTFTSPSVTLPSGVATGPNTLTFGPAEQSEGRLDLTTGNFTATATGTIVNDLFPEGVVIAGSYSGTADIVAGSVSVQSHTWDFIPAGTAGDTQPPVVTINTPDDGAKFLLNQVVAANYTCEDPSGVAQCAGPVPSGSPIDTTSVGSKSFTVAATDNVGNTTTSTHNYQVIYDYSGFFQPVDNPPTVNAVKGGQSIPIKFSLGGNQGLAIGTPASQGIACDTTAPVSALEESATAGSSGLSYDSTLDQYIYTWKTDKSWTGTCRQFVLKLKDETEHVANFAFK